MKQEHITVLDEFSHQKELVLAALRVNGSAPMTRGMIEQQLRILGVRVARDDVGKRLTELRREGLVVGLFRDRCLVTGKSATHYEAV